MNTMFRRILRSERLRAGLALCALAALAGCGGEDGGTSASAVSAQTSASPQPQANPTPPPATAPAAAQAPAVPAAAASTSCRLDPPGGVVVVADRRAPRVLVGDTHAVILHEARRSPSPCHGSPDATIIPVPVTAGLSPARTPAPCEVMEDDTSGRMAQNGRLERVGSVPVFLGCQCDPDPTNGCSCSAQVPPGAFGGRTFGMYSSHTSTGGLGVDLAVDGEWAYLVADMDDTGNGRRGIFGQRIHLTEPAADRAHWRQVGPEPSAATRHGLRIEIVENLPDRTVILYGPESAPRATRVVMGPDGVRQGSGESVDWPAAPAPAVSVMSARDGRRAPPYVRLVVDGQARPITGVNDTVGAFSPALIEVAGVQLLFWSEGMGETTRVYGAPLDVANATVGPRFTVTHGDVESGDVAADVFGGRAVVTWSQREGAGNAVRAANVVCGS